jgi:hypothetical protein
MSEWEIHVQFQPGFSSCVSYIYRVERGFVPIFPCRIRETSGKIIQYMLLIVININYKTAMTGKENTTVKMTAISQQCV